MRIRFFLFLRIENIGVYLKYRDEFMWNVVD